MAMNREKVKLDTTNQVVVRLKKGGTRFEALANRATYLVILEEAKKDIKKYRKEGVHVTETALKDLLIDQQVYLNAAKGQIATQKDIDAAFKNEDTCPKPTPAHALTQILSKGEAQLSEQDRQKSSKGEGDKLKDLSTIVAAKIINPQADPKAGRNAKYYTVVDVERELKNIKYAIKPNFGDVEQVSYMIKALKVGGNFPVERIQHKATVQTDEEDEFKKFCEENPGVIRLISQNKGGHFTVTYDPESVAKEVIKKLCDSVKEEKLVSGKISDEEDLTLHCAEPPEDRKKTKTKKEKQKEKEKKEKKTTADSDDEEEDDSKPHNKKDKKSKRKGKKGGNNDDDDDDDDKEEEAEKEKEKPKPKPKAKAAKKKKGKGGDDSDDEPRGGGRRKGGNLMDDLAALGRAGSDDEEVGGGGGGAFDALAGKKKGKKKK